MIKLSPRLLFVARLAGTGESVIDVGTDHGYLPAYFAENRLFSKIAASDIRSGPLQSAKSSAREYGVEDKIAFYLSDGLRDVPDTFDTVVIAGMGGETMVDIILNCPWIPGARLILQPQSKIAELEKCLEDKGFACERAVLTEDAGKLYAAFSCAKGEGGVDLLRALMESRDPLLKKCLEKEKKRLLLAASGMERGGRQGSGEYGKLLGELLRIEESLTEVGTWQR